ncbi:MAG TPA: tetratricopeptide repeat protein [Candidatus Acidoferrum sp.]|nr:tetratricopeptide repeat protein [Candidatus Acidoferrum sp.]
MRLRSAIGAFIVLVSFAGIWPAIADTIVLKNGRRIVVDSATETVDRVSGVTSAGEISLPKSMVERIEHTPVAQIPSTSANAEASFLPITPPAESRDGVFDPAVIAKTLHDGAIDFGYLSQVDQEVLTGGSSAAFRASVAHHAAAQFELMHGDVTTAIDQERRALALQPENALLLLNIGYGHLRLSEFSSALEYLEKAKRVAPDSADVAKLMGWAYYGLNRIPDAVAEWKRAQKIQPDPEVAKALEKAERDARAEVGFREGQTTHFVIHYTGDAAPLLAGEILRTLEIHFGQISAMLDYTPPEPIGVILYTDQQFQDITRAPSWAGAINDGRIRIPIQGLTSVTDDLSRELRHELTHSFLQQKMRGHCPTWIQEGVAQWMEGRRVGKGAGALLNAYDQQAAIPLRDLDLSWMNLSGSGASFAYGWSLAVIESILSTGSMDDLTHLLDSIANGKSAEAAVRDIFHESYTELDQQTADYLRRTYSF